MIRNVGLSNDLGATLPSFGVVLRDLDVIDKMYRQSNLIFSETSGEINGEIHI